MIICGQSYEKKLKHVSSFRVIFAKISNYNILAYA